ncbi:hypothetical protein NC653_006270 [Populus alba x Populus x berolinensis]|uniref:Secreted protein n=1 Tax=Populus alba x Populus x berolinensis TaxID=444605 RepID=A0AAD6RE04_9ROSI|nr:hypothetical protein NC653_006270 [Populus alba x Populus x berolinensis]
MHAKLTDDLLILTRFYLLIAMIRGVQGLVGMENAHRINSVPEGTGRAQFYTRFNMQLPCHNMTWVVGGLMTQEVVAESCLIETVPYPQTKQ